MIHELKIEQQYFNAIESGDKTFEIRNNDREFQRDDCVTLKEYVGARFTGREIEIVIKYVTGYQQKENFVVFSFDVSSKTL